MEFPKEVDLSVKIDTVTIGRTIIKKGQWVKLQNLLGEDFYKTKYWNREFKQPLIITKPSKKDYSSVYLYEQDETTLQFFILDRLHRLLGNSYYQIDRICKNKETIFILLDNNLLIDRSILAVKEEVVFNPVVTNQVINSKDKEFIAELVESYSNNRIGLFTKRELLNDIDFRYRYYMNYTQKKWSIKHILPMFNTPFYKKK